MIHTVLSIGVSRCLCLFRCFLLMSHFHLVSPSLLVPFLICLSVLVVFVLSLVCSCVPSALSPSMSVCLSFLHWYAPLPPTLSLTVHMMILFRLPFLLSLSISSCLIMAFFVYLCLSLSSALSMFVVFPSLFLFPRSPAPSFLPWLLLLLFTAFTKSQGDENEKNKRTEREQAPFSPPESSKHFCLLFIAKMANIENNRHDDVREKSKQ